MSLGQHREGDRGGALTFVLERNKNSIVNLIWRLMAEARLLVWLWVRIAARRITINVNWQYLVSGSSLLTAAGRWTSHPGSGIPGVELNNNVIKPHQVQDQVGAKSFNKPGNFWDRSKTYQFVRLESYFATETDLFTHGGGAWSGLSGLQDIATRGMGPQ